MIMLYFCVFKNILEWLFVYIFIFFEYLLDTIYEIKMNSFIFVFWTNLISYYFEFHVKLWYFLLVMYFHDFILKPSGPLTSLVSSLLSISACQATFSNHKVIFFDLGSSILDELCKLKKYIFQVPQTYFLVWKIKWNSKKIWKHLILYDFIYIIVHKTIPDDRAHFYFLEAIWRVVCYLLS